MLDGRVDGLPALPVLPKSLLDRPDRHVFNHRPTSTPRDQDVFCIDLFRSLDQRVAKTVHGDDLAQTADVALALVHFAESSQHFSDRVVFQGVLRRLQHDGGIPLCEFDKPEGIDYDAGRSFGGFCDVDILLGAEAGVYSARSGGLALVRPFPRVFGDHGVQFGLEEVNHA